MVGFGLHLAHDIHSQTDYIRVTLGAIPRQAKTGMPRRRLILVAFVAGHLVLLVEREVPVVVQRGRLPRFRRMAALAVSA